MSFAILALICLVGALGPLLAVPERLRIPVVIGELLAGIAFGPSGVGVLHAKDGTFTFLADVGFALVMFVAGSHVPARDPRVRSAVLVGTGHAVGVGLVAVLVGELLATAFGTPHALLYAVLMASSSAALVLPMLGSLRLEGPTILELVAQVAVADTACIVALPLVIQPDRAGQAALGAVTVLAAAFIVYLVLLRGERSGLRHRLHTLSEHRKFALELRLNLGLLFALAALAQRTDVSIMLAGFSFGVAVAAIGEPRRLARQLFALTEGLFAPIFFIWLGATIELADLGRSPRFIGLGVLLGVGAVVVHAATRVVGQPLPMAGLAAAQLGVPLAASALGTRLNLLAPGESAAFVLGALITIVAATVSGALGTRRDKAIPVEGTGS